LPWKILKFYVFHRKLWIPIKNNRNWVGFSQDCIGKPFIFYEKDMKNQHCDTTFMKDDLWTSKNIYDFHAKPWIPLKSIRIGMLFIGFPKIMVWHVWSVMEIDGDRHFCRDAICEKSKTYMSFIKKECSHLKREHLCVFCKEFAMRLYDSAGKCKRLYSDIIAVNHLSPWFQKGQVQGCHFIKKPMHMLMFLYPVSTSWLHVRSTICAKSIC